MQGVAAPRSYGRVRNSTIQRNVDDETTYMYETSEMKQPKKTTRPRLVMAETQLSSERCRHALRQHPPTYPITTPSPPVPCRPQPLGLNGHLTADFALTISAIAQGPSPTSSLSTGLLAHSFRALVALASTSTLVSKGPAASCSKS